MLLHLFANGTTKPDSGVSAICGGQGKDVLSALTREGGAHVDGGGERWERGHTTVMSVSTVYTFLKDSVCAVDELFWLMSLSELVFTLGPGCSGLGARPVRKLQAVRSVVMVQLLLPPLYFAVAALAADARQSAVEPLGQLEVRAWRHRAAPSGRRTSGQAGIEPGCDAPAPHINPKDQLGVDVSWARLGRRNGVDGGLGVERDGRYGLLGFNGQAVPIEDGWANRIGDTRKARRDRTPRSLVKV
ncbi:hypothetical protein K488DRAFT_70014 [Vararia minispora EC-137]|uniref:Uncharacterized protein n=1 Tax=Vararia minispora EC-137 TaxID=1314806 RepID=A0ACB8QN02_9AGAM|nr:hypothetical protein K488DRAFT_70014 [Vararia minispora EC-137]